MTTAAQTHFCAEKVEFHGEHLWIDSNGKITASGGTLENPRPNAFSLRNIEDCPARTSICSKSCYVWGLQKHAPETYKLYEHNAMQIRKILNDDPLGWANNFGSWITLNLIREFRWHVSGDVFSAQYARWIAEVCLQSPLTRHWIYTRSFEFVPYLLQAENLTVNLSADAENLEAARATHAEYPNTRMTYLTSDGWVPDDLPRGSVIFPDYDLRDSTPWGKEWYAELLPREKQMVCPVDFRGKSEQRRCGPCSKCIEPVTIAPPVGGPRRGK